MNFSSLETAVVSVVRNVSEVNWARPFEHKNSEWRNGSGFALTHAGKRYIVTNAHCVSGYGRVMIRKRGSSNLHKANLLAAIEECDLALIEPVDSTFWEDITPLTLNPKMPGKGEKVYAMGYPLGGYNISITEGIVSRIVAYEYSKATIGVAIQVDAPINPGNSGGPVISDGIVIGVTVAKEREEMGVSNMGYIIPTFFVQYLLDAVRLKDFEFEISGRFSGFRGMVTLPVDYQELHNEQMREWLQLPISTTGVLVVHSSSDDFKVFDVLTSVNGIPIYNDGTTPFDGVSDTLQDLIPFRFLINMKHVGDSLRMSVWRKGKAISVNHTLTRDVRSMPLVPSHLPDPIRPSWVIIMGMVFTQQTYMLIEQLQLPHQGSGDSVVLSHIYDTDFTSDFPQPGAILNSVNGVKIQSIAHLCYLLYAPKKKTLDPYYVFEFQNTNWIALLKHSDIAANNQPIIDELGITKFFHCSVYKSTRNKKK